MESFEVTDGDLVLSNGAFATVSGPSKVQQDIKIATLTPYGSDRFHPRYGSVFSSYIGAPSAGITETLIRAEMTRVINNYMKVQLWKVRQATLDNLASPFEQGELVESVGPIHVEQRFDTYQVTGSVNTASGQQVNVSTQIT